MTFAELQDAVLAAIIDTPPTVAAAVPSYVRQAVKDLQDRHSFKVCETVTPIMVTQVHTRLLGAIPSNFCRYRKKPELLEPISGRVLELDLSHSRSAVEREFGTAAGGQVDLSVIASRPRVLLSAEADDTGAANWEVYPLPDGFSTYTDGEYRIRVPYYRYVAELISSPQTNWFTVNAAQFIIQQAASFGFFADHDEERGTLWTQRASNEMLKIIDADRKMRLSSINTLRVSTDARGRRVSYGDN